VHEGGLGGGLDDGFPGRHAKGKRGMRHSLWHRAAWHQHCGCAAALQQGTDGSDVERPLGDTRQDAMAQGGRRTGGQWRGARTRATAWRNNRNRGSDAIERTAEEIWGKISVGEAQLTVTVAREMVMGQLMRGNGPGDAVALGRHGKNGPRSLFQFKFPFLF
jgi:hypothetical protein